jgi:hypothetical protein
MGRNRILSWLAYALVAAMAAKLASAAFAEEKLDSLHAAAKAVETAAKEGAPYERFSELARNFAGELVGANQSAESEQDRALLLLYARAGLAYGDGLSLWREKLEVERSNSLSPTAAGVEPLVARYRITPDPASGQIDADSAIRLIWSAAEASLHKAELLREGRVDELAAIMDEEGKADAERARAAEEAAHQQELIERVAREFNEEARRNERPQPYEASPGNWTCPRGYVVRQGKCLSDDDVKRLPKVEITR